MIMGKSPSRLSDLTHALRHARKAGRLHLFVKACREKEASELLIPRTECGSDWGKAIFFFFFSVLKWKFQANFELVLTHSMGQFRC